MASVQGTSGFGHVHGSSSEAQVRRPMLHSEVTDSSHACCGCVQGLGAVRKMLADNLGACLLVFD